MHATAVRTTLDREADTALDTALDGALTGTLGATPIGQERKEREERRTPPRSPHRWVGAALVDLGLGAAGRAAHADRTGRHTLPGSTRIEVLEVYCTRCRVPYSAQACVEPCRTVAVRAG